MVKSMNAKTYLGNLNAFFSITNVIAGHYSSISRPYDKINGKEWWSRDIDFKVAYIITDSWVGEFTFVQYEEDHDGIRLYYLIIIRGLTVYNSNARFDYRMINGKLREDDTTGESIELWS